MDVFLGGWGAVSDPEAEYIGTEPWHPKEALEGDEITDKADIFAYGLTLWEMMTLAVPHMDLLEHDDEEEQDEGEMLWGSLYLKRGFCLFERPPRLR